MAPKASPSNTTISPPGINGFPTQPPTFQLKDLRRAIPKHCFERSLWRSCFHLSWNLSLVILLFTMAWYIPNGIIGYVAWVLYWMLQGTLMTGIWVIAHECGHQAFSDYKLVNDSIGLVLHSLLLVPYHNWRITHRRHHSNTGSCENDEVFVPVRQTLYEQDKPRWQEYVEDSPLFIGFQIFMMLFIGWMPLYLVFNATGPEKYRGKNANHFSPNAVMFSPKEREDVVISNIGFALAFVGYTILAQQIGWGFFLKWYLIPYFIVNGYLVLITYLQHTDVYIPHFRGSRWNWFHGALCTVDRSFGKWIDMAIHHITDTHVCHHLFSTMPFYHAQEATAIIKDILGPYYLKDDTFIPVALWRAYSQCQYVPDDGDVVFYEKKKQN